MSTIECIGGEPANLVLWKGKICKKKVKSHWHSWKE